MDPVAAVSDYDAFSRSLADEPVTPELDEYLPSLAAGLRGLVLETRPKLAGHLLALNHRIGCPCSQQLDVNTAFVCAMDDADLARYFGRWLRERGVAVWLLNLVTESCTASEEGEP